MAKAVKRKVNYTLPTKNIWFPEQIEPVEEDKENFIAYWKREKDRIINGFYLAEGQVYISGWLYWHTVYWVIELDTLTSAGKSFKTKGTPLLRDIEWEHAVNLERAEREQKIIVEVGSRGYGKSNKDASIVGRMYNFFADSECVVSGAFSSDIKLVTDKVNLGLSFCHPIWQIQRLLNDWKKEVRAGYIDRQTGLQKGSNSRIIVRNYEEGNNTMAANGTRPKIHIIDEIGKIPNLINCVLDTVPCWMNDYGMFSVPILTGTGGDMEVGEDAGKIFNSPVVYNVLEFEDTWEGTGKIGYFVPVTKARNEYKKPQPLSKYLGIEHPDLERVTILVSDEQECLEKYVNPRRQRALKSTTSNDIIKEKAYYPIKPSECFLTVNSNDFPIEACKAQLDWLQKEGIKPIAVELFRNLEGRVTHKYTDKQPVRDYPINASTDKTGVVEVIEFPPVDPPYGAYVAGMDPYKQSESEYSDSLGSIYIFKRVVIGETYSDMPVAWYHGRPKSIHEWFEISRMLLHWYNAQVMCENADAGFIQYMIEKNEEYYLAEGMSFLREINPNTKHRSNAGLPPTIAVINHLNNAAVIYCKEEITKERDAEGKATRTILGVNKILDPMLLQEMIKFNKTKGNFDRVRSFSLAVAWAGQLDSKLPPSSLNKEPIQQAKIVRSPFTIGLNKTFGIKSSFGKSPFMLRTM